MNPQLDEMYRLTALKYMAEIAKKKKVASYQLQQETNNQPLLPLKEAISIKRDLEKMDDSYNPRKVQQYWNQFWEEG